MSRVRTAWGATVRALRDVFWHRWLAVIAVVMLVACGGVAAAAYGYERSNSDVIAKGIRIGSIDIGGLTADEAATKLRRAYRRLEKPVVLRYRGGHVIVSPEQARVRIDVEAIVAKALHQTHQGIFLSRAWRQLTGGRVERKLRPQTAYSRQAVRDIVEGLRPQVERKPVNARVLPSYDRLSVKGGRRGIEVKAARLRWELRHALLTRHADRSIRVPLRRVDPEVTIAALRKQYPSYITIDRGNFTLRVYSHLKLVKSYGIAVGQAGLETPSGVYHIQDKQVDPWWHVPNSAWAGSLAGQVIPPGPSDPLKARWMGLFNGAGIHGTDQDWSIGQAVSHGCVRMHIPDVIDLYDRVEVGTPAYIGN